MSSGCMCMCVCACVCVCMSEPQKEQDARVLLKSEMCVKWNEAGVKKDNEKEEH